MKKLVMGFLITVLVLVLSGIGWSQSFGTAFSYQGKLYDGGSPDNGFFDFEFRLYNHVSDTGAGSQVGLTITKENIEVKEGAFTVLLDFGGDVFNGDVRWLEIAIRPGELADPNVYTTLTPRQKVTPAPYALYAKTAGGVTGQINTSGTGDILVAAADAPEDVKQRAKYICGGADDQNVINAAINEAFNRGDQGMGYGKCGSVVLSQGAFSISGSIIIKNGVSLVGSGMWSTQITGIQDMSESPKSGKAIGIYFSGIDGYQSTFRLANFYIGTNVAQSVGEGWSIYLETGGSTSLYDNIYENVYAGYGKTGAMYVEKEWSGHYSKCTFEHSAGVGYKCDGANNNEYHGCYFALNGGHGALIKGSHPLFTNCAANGNGNDGFQINLTGTSHLQMAAIIGGYASGNEDNGYHIYSGWANLIGVFAHENNKDDSASTGGIKVGTSGAALLTGCRSISNKALGSPSNGTGLVLLGEHHVVNCITGKNKIGIEFGPETKQSYIKSHHFMTGSDADDVKIKFCSTYTSGKHFGVGTTFKDTFIGMTAASTSAIKANVVSEYNDEPSLDGQPDVPRNITVTGIEGASGQVWVSGMTADGRWLNMWGDQKGYEAIEIKGNNTVEGNIAFAWITHIRVINLIGTVNIGLGDKLGLSNPIAAEECVVLVTKNGSRIAEDNYTLDTDRGTINVGIIKENDDVIVLYRSFYRP